MLPDGPAAIVGKELGGEYFDKAGPVIELSVARAGVRLAAWLDRIVAKLMLPPSGPNQVTIGEEQEDDWSEEFEEIEAQVAALESGAAERFESAAQVVVEL